MTFHEEEAFKRSKEIECDLETEEAEAPILEDHDDDSSPYDAQRENLAEHAELPVIDEPVELVVEPLAKRRSTWCRYVLRDAEKHGAPVGTSRKHMHPDKYL